MSAGSALHAQACPPEGGFEARAGQGVGTSEIRLADGRMLKLAGLHIPREGEAAAHDFIAGRLGERAFRYVPLRAMPDRYGRLVAHIILNQRGQEFWLQLALVERGLALVSLMPGETACAARLIEAEGLAQRLRQGMWSVGRGPVTLAEERAGLARLRGGFAMVRGKVVSVGIRDNAVYLNFGTSWTRDFTAQILKKDLAAFAAKGLDFAKLTGRTITVRGYMDARDTPRMTLERVEALDVLDGE